MELNIRLLEKFWSFMAPLNKKFHPDRWFIFSLGVGALCCSIISVYLLLWSVFQPPIFAWFVTILFLGISSISFAMLAFPDTFYLEIFADKIIVKNLIRQETYEFDDVASFQLYRPPSTYMNSYQPTMIAVEFKRARTSFYGKSVRKLFGVDDWFPAYRPRDMSKAELLSSILHYFGKFEKHRRSGEPS